MSRYWDHKGRGREGAAVPSLLGSSDRLEETERHGQLTSAPRGEWSTSVNSRAVQPRAAGQVEVTVTVTVTVTEVQVQVQVQVPASKRR
jgi:VCBS repeat-containing protein